MKRAAGAFGTRAYANLGRTLSALYARPALIQTKLTPNLFSAELPEHECLHIHNLASLFISAQIADVAKLLAEVRGEFCRKRLRMPGGVSEHIAQ